MSTRYSAGAGGAASAPGACQPETPDPQAESAHLRQRISELEQELVRRTQELDRISREAQELVYIASHDLRESSRMVASYTRLLARRYAGKLGPDADEFISYAVDGVGRMQELLDDLLMYARVDNGLPGPLEKASCEVLLHWVLAKFERAVAESGAIVTHDPLPVVDAEEVQISKVFEHLIDNALKFRRQEPPRIHVSASEQDEEWVISVSDNGTGIDPKYWGDLFRPFKRLHGRDYPGSGMGLAIARKIVERHGGRIWVESRPGEGSIFSFTIPF